MKTLGIILTVFLFFGFLSTNAGDIKPEKNSEPISFSFYCMCAGEVLNADAVSTTMIKLHGMQWKLKGTAIGENTKQEYVISSLENLNMVWHKGHNQTYVWTMSVTLDGIEISTIHQNVHVTVNANGETTVDFGQFFIDCH